MFALLSQLLVLFFVASPAQLLDMARPLNLYLYHYAKDRDKVRERQGLFTEKFCASDYTYNFHKWHLNK